MSEERKATKTEKEPAKATAEAEAAVQSEATAASRETPDKSFGGRLDDAPTQQS